MTNIVDTEQIRVRERCNTAKIAIETAIRSLECALLFQADDDIISVRTFHHFPL